MKKAVCIMSGGMDSTLCAVLAKKQGYDIVALHFDYNQRTMSREKRAFKEICDKIGVVKKVELDVSFISDIGANALTDLSMDIRKDGVADDVPNTYVPFRNGIFISIAAALAEKEGAEALFIGVVEEDSSGYPDCSDEFIKSINDAINKGTKDSTNIKIHMPLVHLSKADIVKSSLQNNSPLELTWSCYENEDEACGLCDSCRLRLNGFELAGAKDPIRYKNLNSKIKL
ncbi:7-cyano-7-deazaguanine synthase [Campylobacter pinnipediorum subsp. caledonicus]|uniref:7-cyano-7-deazaguanine synthase n=1 Tax=Campylobacter pinnipediorum subsp. caledonicus TaxID=1874362 RepID=A0A1S6U5C5_9BACT|nr:7-cyano-7-deazaguanine synthase QueC [Campylobacter pinnipediorum]AQW85292.1 7-cyano-7-deazaguanine synthase [Campylobacter pinnipediorum subsp. caledonicus]AQW86899.1 7-cyano-7-deazaguanine synthase [Campylobacter pinnipediorum subsp. caledonicus]OPA71202.1 7-cyano-7-deazaguanine synthase QueC [Campylobacter pinnipediorum subsp. caledonicus]